jgi:hypothetical protein
MIITHNIILYLTNVSQSYGMFKVTNSEMSTSHMVLGKLMGACVWLSLTNLIIRT